MKSDYVYYDANFDEIIFINYQQHTSFGIWYYPAHNIIYLGEL